MQDQGDRPVRSARPTLLSSEPQSGPQHQRILSALEGAPVVVPATAARAGAAAEGVRRKPRTLLWSGLGLGALAAAGLFFMPADDEERAPHETVAAPSPARAGAVPALVAAVRPGAPAASKALPPAAALPTGAAAAGPAAPSAATAMPATTATPADAPAPAGKPGTQATAAASAAPESANPLAALAPTPVHAPASALPHHDQLTQALEKPSKQPRRAPPADAAAKPKPRSEEGRAGAKSSRHAAPSRAAPAKPTSSKAAPSKGSTTSRSVPKEQDSDVALLAALMSHMQARPKPATPAEQLKVCRQYNAAGEAQCRARLCQGAARKEPACRSAALAKSAAD